MHELGLSTVRVSGRDVVTTVTALEYAELASSVGVRSGPIPVAAEAWASCQAALERLPVVGSAPAAHWQGVVLVAEPVFTAVGEVLARGSGRPLLHGDLREAVELSRNGPVTVVAGVGEITPERLAAIPADAPIGFVLGQDAADMSALVARTLLQGPALAALSDLSFDTLSGEDPAPGLLVGEQVTPTGLRAAIGDGVAVLAGSGHGRDCIMHLDGGGICGRAEDLPLLQLLPPIRDGWTEHPTSCQQGEGCWRGDFDIANHLRASEMRVAIAVLDSCRTAVAGGGAIRPDVSVPLTMLRGTAIAVLSALGTRSGAGYAGQLATALIRSGLSLGAVVGEVNRAITADPEGLGRLVLFGDAGLVAAPADPPIARRLDADGSVVVAEGGGAVLVECAALHPVESDGPLAVDRGVGASWVLTRAVGRRGGRLVAAGDTFDEAWEQRVHPWLTRLQALPYLGITPEARRLDAARRTAVAALRARSEATHAAAARYAADRFASVLDELADVQHGIVKQEVARVARSFYAFVDGWAEPWRVTSDVQPEMCPQCGIDGAVRHRVRPAAGAGPQLCYLVCARCGEVLAGDSRFGAEVVLHAPGEALRGAPFTVTAAITAPLDRPVDVAIGAAVVFESIFDMKSVTCQELRLGPGERLAIDLTVETGAGTFPDLQPVKVIVAADGAVQCLTRSVWLRV
ncbi:hypothetical protein GCM10011609_86710 [Lentzea pudingi]|uniref:Uncharacterized protein n=1 Tax=Lentzea pudingi TaxID=1789439 RepID=A0ABQ2IW92_9PSEU|nr:hypothetical protein [Lentzea pudingi]GGN29518.1 hypothetical protein GCM10011609_86710 [Lentzea pudingi]